MSEQGFWIVYPLCFTALMLYFFFFFVLRKLFNRKNGIEESNLETFERTAATGHGIPAGVGLAFFGAIATLLAILIFVPLNSMGVLGAVSEWTTTNADSWVYIKFAGIFLFLALFLFGWGRTFR